jgi:hypothetical protein
VYQMTRSDQSNEGTTPQAGAKKSSPTNHHDQAMGPVGRLFRSINKKGKGPTSKKGQKMGSCQSTEAGGVKGSTTSKQTRSGAKSAKGESFSQSGDFFSFRVARFSQYHAPSLEMQLDL